MGLRDINYEWFLEADLGKFKGLYIAIVGGRVVESGKDPERIYLRAKQKHPDKEVVLWKVPKEETLVL